MSTNTVVIYGLHPSAFDGEAAALKTVAQDSAGFAKWIEVRFLNRILVVYTNSEQANAAQKQLSTTLDSIPNLGEEGVRVGRSVGDIELDSTNEHTIKYLELPDRGRLLFVSPPPSPPAEWDGDGSLEEEPNKLTHATKEFDQALNRALCAIKPRDGSPSTVDTPTSASASASARSQGQSDSAATTPITLVAATPTAPGLQVELDNEQ